MSLRAMVWVLYESAAGTDACVNRSGATNSRGVVRDASEATDRLVLLAIADDAADDGTGAYPKIETIAAKAGCHRATAIRSIEALEAAGELLVKRPRTQGRGRFNRYTMVMGRDIAQVAAAVGWPPPEWSHRATFPDPVDGSPAPPVSPTGKGPQRSHEAPGKVAPVLPDPLTHRPLGRKRVTDDPAATAEHIAAQRALAERNAARAADDVEPPADLAAVRAAAAAARAALRPPALPSPELDVEEPTA